MSSETIRKYDLPHSIDIQTATALFYIGLMGLMANLVYFYAPIASLFIILLLFIQKRWHINNVLLKIAVVLTLMPLLINLSAALLQQIVILIMGRISSLGSDIQIKFAKENELFYVISEIVFVMMLLSSAGISAALLLLNIIFPICKKLIRIIISPLFLVSMLVSFFLSLLGGLEAYSDSIDYLTGKFKMPVELIIDKKINDYHIRAYRTNYGGALGAFSVQVTQEKDLPFQLKFVREISQYDHCDRIQLDLLSDHTIRIKPEIDSHETNHELSLPKIFYLKPF